MKSIIIALLVCSAITSGIVYSHSGAKGIGKERMDAMKTITVSWQRAALSILSEI